MCVRPIKCFLNQGALPTFSSHGDSAVPCGKCHECISLRATDWSIRTQHELGDHDANCCVTLTYDAQNLPSLTDRKLEFQLFMKRLRERSKKKILYLVSHEFGGQTARLHHHAILFGINFPDMRPFKTTPKGTQLFTSRVLSSLWTHGWSNIGEASVRAGFYIASYALKKSSITTYDENGEISEICDSMNCSTRPAIGLNYLRRNHRQMVLRGDRLPRYYIKKLRELHTLEKKLADLSPYELNLRKEMLDSLTLYDGMHSHSELSPHQKLARYENFRSKLKNDGDYRKKTFTKSDNLHYQYFKDEMLSSLTLESL